MILSDYWRMKQTLYGKSKKKIDCWQKKFTPNCKKALFDSTMLSLLMPSLIERYVNFNGTEFLEFLYLECTKISNFQLVWLRLTWMMNFESGILSQAWVWLCFHCCRVQFHQRYMYIFHACRSQKRKKTLMTYLYFYAFEFC